jgi:hypothetical protein
VGVLEARDHIILPVDTRRIDPRHSVLSVTNLAPLVPMARPSTSRGGTRSSATRGMSTMRCAGREMMSF